MENFDENNFGQAEKNTSAAEKSITGDAVINENGTGTVSEPPVTSYQPPVQDEPTWNKIN